ncbi:MAG: type II toxin-antitoxin system HicA family toxin [Vicinamibacterales bacterium]
MGRLRRLSGRAVCEILRAHGFTAVRQRGSHIVMQRLSAEGSTTVPVPDHAEIRVGTLASIIRQSGVPRAAFETE